MYLLYCEKIIKSLNYMYCWYLFMYCSKLERRDREREVESGKQKKIRFRFGKTDVFFFFLMLLLLLSSVLPWFCLISHPSPVVGLLAIIKYSNYDALPPQPTVDFFVFHFERVQYNTSVRSFLALSFLSMIVGCFCLGFQSYHIPSLLLRPRC